MSNDLFTVKQFNEQYPAFSNGFLRAAIFNARTNGLDKAVIRISPTGKRGKVLIDATEFFKWVRTSNRKTV